MGWTPTMYAILTDELQFSYGPDLTTFPQSDVPMFIELGLFDKSSPEFRFEVLNENVNVVEIPAISKVK